MNRLRISERPNWQSKVEALGFRFHSVGGRYWDESACYTFSMPEIERIEDVTKELFDMCLEVVERAIEDKRLAEWHIPHYLHRWIADTWQWDDVTIYGRFDLGIDTEGNIKLLEFNADTPTSLLEAAVVQWNWLQEVFPRKDQFNSIHEMLIAQFEYAKSRNLQTIHFAAVGGNEEDYMNVAYLMDCATQAGVEAIFLTMEEIGWNGITFVDKTDAPIKTLFKLYPWEYMWGEAFGKHLTEASTAWIEPAWKMILSNKTLLVALWEMFPNHPLLLPTYTKQSKLSSFVQKPIWGREGANVSIAKNGRWILETEGDYSDNPQIFQQYAELAHFEGNRPVIGSWVVGDTPCGIGIRETKSLVHNNLSRFVPHYIDD